MFDREDKPIIRLIHDLAPNCFAQLMAGEWIPLQSLIINQEYFHRVGGFNPLIPGAEDIDLARRMSLRFDFNGTQELVAGVEMGNIGSTTNRGQTRIDARQARELILSESEVYKCLQQSAGNGFWRGRIARLYLTSSHWNLSQGNFFTALSRTLYGLLALLGSFFSPGIFGALSEDLTRVRHLLEDFLRGNRNYQETLAVEG